MLSLFFDITLVTLLFAAIIFCYRLNARLKNMKQMGEELSPFLKNVAGYISQISQTIDKLKSVTDSSNEVLNEKIPLAITLKDDFDILLEYSEKMAMRLDDVIAKAREVDKSLQETLRLSEAATDRNRSIDDVLNRMRNMHPTGHHAEAQQSTVSQVPNSAMISPVSQAPASHLNRAAMSQPTHQKPPAEQPYTPDFFSMPELDLNSDEKEFFLSNLLARSDFEHRKATHNGIDISREKKVVQQKVGIMAKLRGLR